LIIIIIIILVVVLKAQPPKNICDYFYQLKEAKKFPSKRSPPRPHPLLPDPPRPPPTPQKKKQKNTFPPSFSATTKKAKRSRGRCAPVQKQKLNDCYLLATTHRLVTGQLPDIFGCKAPPPIYGSPPNKPNSPPPPSPPKKKKKKKKKNPKLPNIKS